MVGEQIGLVESVAMPHNSGMHDRHCFYTRAC